MFKRILKAVFGNRENVEASKPTAPRFRDLPMSRTLESGSDSGTGCSGRMRNAVAFPSSSRTDILTHLKQIVSNTESGRLRGWEYVHLPGGTIKVYRCPFPGDTRISLVVVPRAPMETPCVNLYMQDGSVMLLLEPYRGIFSSEEVKVLCALLTAAKVAAAKEQQNTNRRAERDAIDVLRNFTGRPNPPPPPPPK